MRVALRAGADGAIEAVKHPQEGAGVITSLTETDGLAGVLRRRHDGRAGLDRRLPVLRDADGLTASTRSDARRAVVAKACSSRLVDWRSSTHGSRRRRCTMSARRRRHDKGFHGYPSDPIVPELWTWNHYELRRRGQAKVVQASRMLRRNALGRGGILRRIDVEKRIDRLGRPIGQRDAMPRGPDLDLAQVFLGQRLAAGRRAAPPAIARPPDAAIRRSARRRAACRPPARA